MNVSSVKNLNGEVLSAVQDASLTNVIQTNSGNWQDITAYQNASAKYLTEVSIPESATWNEVSTTVQTNSAQWSEVGTGGDEEVNSFVYNNSATIVDVDNSYKANSGSFLTAVPSTYLQNTNLEITNNKITGISGVPLAAGGDVPEGVMSESGLEYNAVNEISGYNGSAIAQYGAEKQWLVHDDTLVHASNSAQYALGCNISALQRLMGIDETVLYSNLTGRPINVGSYIDLSESPLNFTEIEIYLKGSIPTGSNNISNGYEKVPVEQLSSSNGLEFLKEFAGEVGSNNTVFNMGCGYSGTSGTRWTKWYGYAYSVHNKNVDFNNNAHLNIWKVIGIGRKA